jgi:3-oxo-5-alpha-steroid 4-dehydrogenase 1
MSPMHISVALSALFFNVLNGACIGGYLGGYGPVTTAEWSDRMIYLQVGLVIWICGFLGNIYHDDELRELRRSSIREQEQKAKSEGIKDKKSVDKVYKIPQAGLFEFILYPHYFCEWIEWTGYWIIGGWSCIPARSFLLNEVTAMLPQAVSGKRWYIERFGKEKIGNRKAVIPGLL